jgi:hypothetical protein
MVHRHLVRNDIDTISKTAYNHRIQGAKYQFPAKLCAVRCDLASTHTLIILLFFKLICPEVNNKGAINTMFQPLWVIFALKMRHIDFIVLINASSALALSKIAWLFRFLSNIEPRHQWQQVERSLF